MLLFWSVEVYIGNLMEVDNVCMFYFWQSKIFWISGFWLLWKKTVYKDVLRGKILAKKKIIRKIKSVDSYNDNLGFHLLIV